MTLYRALVVPRARDTPAKGSFTPDELRCVALRRRAAPCGPRFVLRTRHVSVYYGTLRHVTVKTTRRISPQRNASGVNNMLISDMDTIVICLHHLYRLQIILIQHISLAYNAVIHRIIISLLR